MHTHALTNCAFLRQVIPIPIFMIFKPSIFYAITAPHVDSIKFSGDMIASLSLGSSRILRLKLDPEFAHLYSSQDPSVPTTIECAVHPRSLYILSGPMRYHYTHEILGVAQTELTTLTEINTKEIANDENEGEGTNSKGYSLARRLSIMHRDEKKHSNIQS